MRHKQFTHNGINYTARLEGETLRTVAITRDEHDAQPLINLDPVDHDLAHRLQKMNDAEFLDRAIDQAINENLFAKAAESGGPVVALLKG